jgi:hypothetical protein
LTRAFLCGIIGIKELKHPLKIMDQGGHLGIQIPNTKLEKELKL